MAGTQPSDIPPKKDEIISNLNSDNNVSGNQSSDIPPKKDEIISNLNSDNNVSGNQSSDIPPKKDEIISNLNSEIMAGRTVENSTIKNQAIIDIERIDKWASVGADNGLFLDEKNREIYKRIVDGLKNSRLSLGRNDVPETQKQLSNVIQDYSEAIHNKSFSWRFVNLYGGYMLTYLLVFLIAITSFYAFLGISQFKILYPTDPISYPFSNAPEIAVHAVTWGMIGGILRGLWYLKDKVGDRKFRKSWNVYFISVPFIGGLFGALIYLIISAGMLALNPSLGQNPVPSAVPELAKQSIALDDIKSNLSEATQKIDASAGIEVPRLANPTNSTNPTVSNSIESFRPDFESAAFNYVQATSNNQSGNNPVPDDEPAKSNDTLGLGQEINKTDDTKAKLYAMISNLGQVINKTEDRLGKVNATISNILKEAKGSQNIITQPLAIMFLAALAGFNWEWLMMVIKRTGQNLSGGNTKSFDSLLQDDITKLDR